MKLLTGTEGLWAMLQALAAITAIYFSTFHLALQKRRRDLENLVSARNVAFFTYRATKWGFEQKRDAQHMEQASAAVEVCTKSLEGIDLISLSPPRIIEKFVGIRIQAAQISALMKTDREVREGDDKIVSRMKGELDSIDQYLISHGIHFENDDYTHYVRGLAKRVPRRITRFL
ncbi:hypothetical protein [Pararhizobium sp. DWP1-1-3]|uniref:hypothetical protein n=1 Tax=Pararhizobium sp. DWP1-1-3 TaxID=2804652 RepID=UPI003CF3DA59